MFPPNSPRKLRAVDADAIYTRRIALGLSVADLAAEAGVGEMTIYRLESGATQSRMGTLCRVAKALQVDVECLLTESVAA
jgi:transcriptional regulator with XRE-family HTH domain